jgi:hypothetical protein
MPKAVPAVAFGPLLFSLPTIEQDQSAPMGAQPVFPAYQVASRVAVMARRVAHLNIARYSAALAEQEEDQDQDRREIFALLTAEEEARLLESSPFKLVWSSSAIH